MVNNLDLWLTKLEKIHPLAMDFKLDRITKVYNALKIEPIAPFIITVAGTNGKGSTATTISSIATHSDLTVGLYTSPHIHLFNERIQIDGQCATDQEIIYAFEVIDKARGDITLTYFEFATLAAFYIFKQHAVDIAVLEVGLGGRLDATNIINANIAVITPIAIDHTAQLGNTIDEIAMEKAGIIKNNCLVVSAENKPSPSIIKQSQKQNASLLHADKDFKYNLLNTDKWQYQCHNHTFVLPFPKLNGEHQLQNAATAITALLNSPVSDKITESTISKGLLNTNIHGRFEKIIYKGITFYFDVTHNPQGAMILHQLLQPFKQKGHNIIAVLGMLIDKDANHLVEHLKNDISHWILSPLDGERGQSAELLKSRVAATLADNDNISIADNVADACQKAVNIQRNNDIILVFGSFHTVSEGLNWIYSENKI